VRLELIENRGPNTLLAAFRELLGKARVLDAEVAFVSADGVGTLLPYLRRVAARGKVRIITGLYQGITEPAALRLLLAAERQTNGRLQVRLARDPRFHRKLYFSRNSKACCVISGSSNLTAEGLKSSGEFDLLVRLADTDPQTRRLVSEFDRIWKTGAVPLSAERIKRYEKTRPRQPQPKLSRRSLTQVLGSASLNGGSSGNVSPSSAPGYWRDRISGFAPAKTEAVVGEETDWEQKGYWWYSSHAPVFKRGDRILLFDQTIGWAQVVVVKDTTRTATPTPDGRHFVAYQGIRGWRRRRLNRALWKRLADVGLPLSSEARDRRRKFSEGQWGRVASIFQR
jgi:HKD family nuclease